MFKRSVFVMMFLVFVLSPGKSYGDVANILVNPGFESPTDGSPWAARGCTFATTTSQKNSGSRSGLASGRTATWQGIQQDVLGKMVVGQTYTVSGFVRLSTGSSDVHLTFQKTDGDGTAYAWAASGTANNTSWTQISGSYNLTANGTLSELLVYVESDSNTASIYLDDVNVFGQVPGPTPDSATGNINTTVGHQVLDGFGASGSWYEGDVVTYGNSHPEIYNILFRDLGLDIYRIRNTYNIDSTYISNTATIISNGNATMGRPLRIMNTSWSPPASLKSNDSTRQGTLAKDGYGNYRYADFAQWWRDSLTAWTTAGVTTYYVNMQNEPNFVTSGWDTCQFIPDQNSSLAGYKQAFAALYANLNTMPDRPLLLAPEGQNIGFTADYVNALTSTDKSNVYGYSHHLYDGSADAPDAFISPMATLKAAIGGDNKPLMQTEFSGGGPYDYTDEMNLAKLIHNALTVEEVSAYLYWELFWNNGTDSLVNVTSSSYAINPVYWPMKHYSYFTDPEWQRIDADTNSTSLRISAFLDPEGQKLSAIILNTDETTDIDLTLSFTGFTVTDGNVWCSTSSQNCTLTGSFTPGSPVTLPANSITTLQLFSTEPPEPPDKATSPSPFNGATGVNITTDLSWTAGARATSHDVYFGTTSPGTYQGNQTGTSFDTGTMASNTRYYWRIDEKNGGGTTTGDVWSFTTAPPDTTPPTPNPMTWATVPTATGAFTITMTASTANDAASPPVLYYFECTTDGTKSSSWQSSPTYLASGLTPSTLYTFRVKARDSAPALNETGWSTSLSATTSEAPINIEILGSWVTGTTHAKESGYHPALIFIAHAEHSTTLTLNSVTYGGQTMTPIVSGTTGGTSYQAYVAAYILNEAGIAAATDGTFNPVWNTAPTAPDNVSYASVFLQNVDQTTLIGATASNSTTSGTPNPIMTAALDTNNGDMVIDAAVCGNSGDYTLLNGFTEAIEHDMGSSTGSDGYKSATGAAETPSAQHSNVNRQVIIGFVVQATQAPEYENCAEVIADNHRLAADISGSGDCYVDFADFVVLAGHWLDNNCAASGNCGGADFEPADGIVDIYDMGDFADQWLLCNDPANPNCPHNW
jgi:glucuronoarabinoxylan endo-1,4-beta-xylanase